MKPVNQHTRRALIKIRDRAQVMLDWLDNPETVAHIEQGDHWDQVQTQVSAALEAVNRAQDVLEACDSQTL